MGTDDRDYEYRPRGQSERRREPYVGSDAPGRSSQRGRSNDYDDPRSGSRSDRGGYDRRPRSDQSGSGRRPRSDWDDDSATRRDRRGPDPYPRGGGSGRGPRPPRDDWESSARSRGGPRSPSPADSGARNRRGGAAVASPRGGGGIWGDQPMSGSGARRGAIDQRDPRARRGMPQPEEEETSGAAAFGKGLMAIIMALLIGAGAAYGYYVYSTPKLPAGIAQPPAAPTTAPTAAPTTSPTAKPTSTSTGLRSTPALPGAALAGAPRAYSFVVAPALPRA
ncbi:MAG: hypothetical protein ACHQ1E_11060 [Ktedonobacterales bacterium]